MKYKYNGQWVDVNIKALDSMEIGSIIAFAGDTIPTGWLECDGSTITQSAYPELYDLIGGTLPDFRGRVLVGQDTNDTDFDTIGKTGGSKELQKHYHPLNSNTLGSYYTGIGAVSSSGDTSVGRANENPALASTGNAGTGESGNLQPYAVVKHIIKAKNTTPTMASVVNAHSTSTTDTYSCDYENKHYGGVVLYENENGTTGNVTLSETIANFNYLEIEYVRSGYTKSTGKIKANATPTLDGYWYYYDSGLGKVVFQNYCEIPEISGTTITRRDTYYTNVVGDGGGTYTGNFPNGISITRVVGYK